MCKRANTVPPTVNMLARWGLWKSTLLVGSWLEDEEGGAPRHVHEGQVQLDVPAVQDHDQAQPGNLGEVTQQGPAEDVLGKGADFLNVFLWALDCP